MCCADTAHTCPQFPPYRAARFRLGMFRRGSKGGLLELPKEACSRGPVLFGTGYKVHWQENLSCGRWANWPTCPSYIIRRRIFSDPSCSAESDRATETYGGSGRLGRPAGRGTARRSSSPGDLLRRPPPHFPAASLSKNICLPGCERSPDICKALGKSRRNFEDAQPILRRLNDIPSRLCRLINRAFRVMAALPRL